MLWRSRVLTTRTESPTEDFIKQDWLLRGGVVLGPKMRERGVYASVSCLIPLGSGQRDETASRGPASTLEGIPFGMSLQ